MHGLLCLCLLGTTLSVQEEPVRPSPAGIRGVLVAPSGDWLANARITLLQWRSEPELVKVDECVTDALGRFELKGDALQESEIDVELLGRRSSFSLGVSLCGGRTIDVGELTFPDRRSLSGRVVDSEGEGIEGVRVRALGRDTRRFLSRGDLLFGSWMDLFEYRAGDLVVDSRGEFARVVGEEELARRFLVAPPVEETLTGSRGEYAVEVARTGTSILFVDRRGWSREIVVEPVAGFENASVPDTILDSGRMVSGTVQRDGAAIEGASVWVAAIDETLLNVALAAGTTAVDGGFSLIGLLDETHSILVVVQQEESGPYWIQRFEPQAPLLVEVPRPCTLEARVRDSNGNPLSEVSVLVSSEQGSIPSPRDLSCDAEGWVRIDSVWPGTGTLWARTPNHEWARAEYDASDEASGPLEIVLREQSRFSLRIREGSTGRPVEGAILQWGTDTEVLARSDEHGDLELTTERMPLDMLRAYSEQSLVLRHASFVETPVPIASLLTLRPGECLELPLEEPHRLVGRVRVHGAPPKFPCCAEIVADGWLGAFQGRSALVNSAGLFEIFGLPEGEWQFRLRAEEALTTSFEDFSPYFDSSSTVYECAVRIGPEAVTEWEVDATPLEERSLVLEGVVRLHGRPTGGLSVGLSSDDHSAAVVTDEDGRFRLEEIPGGHHTLSINYYGKGFTSPLGTERIFLEHSVESFDRNFQAHPVEIHPVYEDGEAAWESTIYLRPVESLDEYVGWGDTGKDAFAVFVPANTNRVQVQVFRYDMGMGVQWIDLPVKAAQTVTLQRCVPCAGRIAFPHGAPDAAYYFLTFVLVRNVNGFDRPQVDYRALVPADRPFFDATDIVPGIYEIHLQTDRGEERVSQRFRVDRIGSTDLVVEFGEEPGAERHCP